MNNKANYLNICNETMGVYRHDERYFLVGSNTLTNLLNTDTLSVLFPWGCWSCSVSWHTQWRRTVVPHH